MRSAWPKPCVPGCRRPREAAGAGEGASRAAALRRVDSMRDQDLLNLLERLAEQLQIPVTYASLATDELPGRGGLCVVQGERRIIIERSLPCPVKARLLASGLARFDLEDVYLPPAVRLAIEHARSGSGGSTA